ncbi:MAG: hypothetical protein M3O28_06685 [Actinomycetota bacterium]|nr:hypothetical protein [Actinomycetota bacterium]
MRTMSMLRQHRALRWLAPVAVAGVVGLAASGIIAAKASTNSLPATSTAQLLADVGSTSEVGFSGTVVAQLALGLPELPSVAQGAGDSSIAGLLSGSHTMRLWYGGPNAQRIAILGPTSETDVFHSGQNLWEWDSAAHVATRFTVPPDSGSARAPLAPAPPTSSSAAESTTPQQLASRVIAALNPSTVVTMGATHLVADRSAYDLVLTPRDAGSRVASVHIAVDGATKIPLGVQVYARGSSAAAIDVAFSDIDFTAPPASSFDFTPPPGATVHENTLGGAAGKKLPSGSPESGSGADGGGTAGAGTPTTVGSAWSTIVEYHVTTAQLDRSLGSARSALMPVSGTWGRGHLLDSALLCVLVTDDQRVFAGFVDPQALYVAAAAHPAAH